MSLRACTETGRGPAARDCGGGPGGEAGASPEWAVRTEPTPATVQKNRRPKTGPLPVSVQAPSDPNGEVFKF